MIARSVTWRPDVDGRDWSVAVRLTLADVGEVEAAISVVADDDPADPTVVTLGPLTPDELTDLGAAILDAAEAARRWGSDTAR